jgi:adenylate cyclase class IV
MAEKTTNEITIKVNVSNDEFMNYLNNNGFKETEIFTLDDYFFIPKDLDLDSLSVREIIAKAIIIRDIKGNHTRIPRLTYKIKEINEKGEIISQRAINCNIYDKEEAKQFLDAIGYYEIMNIKESDILYSNGEFEVGTKHIENFDTVLIEIETDDKYDTTQKLIDKVKELDFPVDYSNCYVKKAEIILEKILKR